MCGERNIGKPPEEYELVNFLAKCLSSLREKCEASLVICVLNTELCIIQMR